MPRIIDAETIHIDDLPGIWSPVQWELTPQERNQELEEQATASLLRAVDVPEAMLRMLLDEIDIERAYEPPDGYDPDMQGEWDGSLVTFKFKRPIRLERIEREGDFLYVEYNFGDLGHWAVEIETEKVIISRI